MKLRLLDYIFTCLVILVSLIPLLPLRGWQGYDGLGGFYYTGNLVRLRYNDLSLGNDKPHVFIVDAGRPISLIEFSDDDSYVNGCNIYANFATRAKLEGGRLLVLYESAEMSFIKVVEPGEDYVKVTYASNQTMKLNLTLWRWYFSSVGPFSMPITKSLDPCRALNFSVAEGGKTYVAQASWEPMPEKITVSGVPGEGLNKVTLDFTAKEVTVEIKLLSPEGLSRLIVLDMRGSEYLYPIIAITMSSLYLLMRHIALKGDRNEARGA
jgi:hypothetical protein